MIVVEGPAGIGKSSLLAAVARVAEAGGVAVLRARGGPLEQDAAWGVARQLFAPVRASAAGSELAVGAAALARRALDPDAPEPAPAGDAMHAAAHGLTWLASNLAERGRRRCWSSTTSTGPTRRRCAGWPSSPAGSTGWRSACCVAVRAGEPAGAARLLAELLRRRRRSRRCARGRSGPAAAEALVRERLPAAGAAFAHACHAVTGGNPFLLGALLAHLVAERRRADRRGRGAV